MKELIVRWETLPGPLEQVTYFANEQIMGTGKPGFEKVIKMIWEDQQIGKVILKAPLILGLGGGRLESAFPFSSEYEKLKEAVGERDLTISHL